MPFIEYDSENFPTGSIPNGNSQLSVTWDDISVAEQAAESLHWHYRLRDAMEAIRLELRDDDGLQGVVRLGIYTIAACTAMPRISSF